RRHTRFSRDWSSDVCSSDLIVDLFGSGAQELRRRLADVPDPGRDILSIADAFRRYINLDRNIAERQRLLQDLYRQQRAITTRTRSEERRVGQGRTVRGDVVV